MLRIESSLGIVAELMQSLREASCTHVKNMPDTVMSKLDQKQSLLISCPGNLCKNLVLKVRKVTGTT
jgi:hypothetical protein